MNELQAFNISDDEVRRVFDRFIKLHPNREEAFVRSLDNYNRWKAHIANTEKVHAIFREEFSIDFAPDFVTLIENRKAETFEGLGLRAQSVYEEIAACFPGHIVCAVGSRVNGNFIDRDDPENVKTWRINAGMSPKDESDFDFVTPGLKKDNRALPKYADWLPYNTCDTKIMIPTWDFSKLPKTEYANVLAYLEEGNERGLLELHNKYELSQTKYCCNLNGMMAWFRNAEREGLFNV